MISVEVLPVIVVVYMPLVPISQCSMRPDKKKVRHHDSRKKAAEAKRKAADQEKGKRPSQPEDAACGSRRQDAVEGEAEAPASSSEFGKRNITSNWTKYEIPSSDDESGGRLNSEGEEDPNTGESYADVLAGAGGSASLLREEEDQSHEVS